MNKINLDISETVPTLVDVLAIKNISKKEMDDELKWIQAYSQAYRQCEMIERAKSTAYNHYESTKYNGIVDGK